MRLLLVLNAFYGLHTVYSFTEGQKCTGNNKSKGTCVAFNPNSVEQATCQGILLSSCGYALDNGHFLRCCVIIRCHGGKGHCKDHWSTTAEGEGSIVPDDDGDCPWWGYCWAPTKKITDAYSTGLVEDGINIANGDPLEMLLSDEITQGTAGVQTPQGNLFSPNGPAEDVVLDGFDPYNDIV